MNNVEKQMAEKEARLDGYFLASQQQSKDAHW